MAFPSSVSAPPETNLAPDIEQEPLLAEVLPPASADMAQMLVDGLRPAVRPQRTAADVWAIAREYTEKGGLLDLTEDVATLAALEAEVRQGDLELKERVETIAKLVNHRVNAKRAHIAVQKDRNTLLTHEQFQAFLADVFEVLQRHLGNDLMLLRRIGLDMGEVLTRMQQRSAAGV